MKLQNHYHSNENRNESSSGNKQDQTFDKSENRMRKQEDERISKDRERVKNQQTPPEVWALSDRVLGKEGADEIENGYRSPFTPF